MTDLLAKKWANGIIPDSANRDLHDFYPTPPRATNALLDVETFVGEIWEPACGDGAISKILSERGHDVFSTDLVDRGYGHASGVDFLTTSIKEHVENVVTNPPFKLAVPFVERALRRSTRKVAILARLAFLEGKARRVLFTTTPLARVHVFSSRVAMARGGEWTNSQKGLIAFAWYVWEHGHEGPPTIGWLP